MFSFPKESCGNHVEILISNSKVQNQRPARSTCNVSAYHVYRHMAPIVLRQDTHVLKFQTANDGQLVVGRPWEYALTSLHMSR